MMTTLSFQNFVTLLEIFSTVGKVSKLSALRLSEDQVVITHNERAASGGTTLWCEVNQVFVFPIYYMHLCYSYYIIYFHALI